MKARIGTRTVTVREERKRIKVDLGDTMLPQSFFVPGSFPRLNMLIGRNVRWEYSALKKEWGSIIQSCIAQAKLKPMKRAHIYFHWQEKDKRKDPDNIAGIGKKFILDALVKAGILPDDGWDEIAGWTDVWRVQKDNVGVLITLEPHAGTEEG